MHYKDRYFVGLWEVQKGSDKGVETLEEKYFDKLKDAQDYCDELNRQSLKDMALMPERDWAGTEKRHYFSVTDKLYKECVYIQDWKDYQKVYQKEWAELLAKKPSSSISTVH